jgi:hypothetical protein
MILQIIEKMNQGGAVTIYFIKALRNNLRIHGLAKLIASYGWFVFAWGSLGSAFGLIVAFDTLKTRENNHNNTKLFGLSNEIKDTL